MIVPRFSVSQTYTQVLITIYAPRAVAKNTAFFIEDNDFRFYNRPYYLHLTFPGKLLIGGVCFCRYMKGPGKFIIRVFKAVVGEHFHNLGDLMTKKKFKVRPSIDPFDSGGESETSLSDYDYCTEETLLNTEEEDLLSGGVCAISPVVEEYGFSDMELTPTPPRSESDSLNSICSESLESE